MAGTKMGTKGKMKDDKGKFLNSNGSGEEPDSSILRRPIQTSITGFAQARKIFDTSTEELKGLLTSECDLLYECKVCRNMFRSLANFVSHKRVYCKEKFSTSMHGHFGKTISTSSEIMKIKQLEEGYQEFLRNQQNANPTTKQETPDERVPLSRDLTAVMENLIKHKSVTKASEENSIEVATQKIPSSKAAVFQNLVSNDDSSDDMCAQITELDQFAAKDKAVLKEDGKFELCADVPQPKEETEPVIQISDDDDTQLSCSLCNIQFSTRKTLKFHMKYKHVPDRLVFPCTDCCDTFSTSWSVLRHLYRTHRKSLTQMRRMREVVQSRAFRMNNVPSSFVKKNNRKAMAEQKLTEEERMDQENQAWMDNMESDSEGPRCGGCGRSFERRAALAAHTYTCQSRTRALARRPAPAVPPPPPPPLAKRDARKEKAEDAEKLTIKQIKPSIMEKEAKDSDTGEEADSDEEKMEVDEPPSTEGTEKNEPEPEAEEEPKEEPKTAPPTFPDEVERANMEALRKKISEYVDKMGTQCKICKRKYTSPSHLCRHMSSHFNWKRYGCKLCAYVNYDRNRLVHHAHNAHRIRFSDDAHVSTIKALTSDEALKLATWPDMEDVEWEDVREATESSVSSPSSRSSDNESESSASQLDAARRNRRKQSFKTKKNKSKCSSPVKDEDKPDKAAVKRPAQASLDVTLEQDKPKRLNPDTSARDPQRNTTPDNVNSSQRPVRKRTRPKKDEDFEYDLTNLMRWDSSLHKEAESKVTPTSRTITSKRKSQAETPSSETSPEKVEKQKNEGQEKPQRDEKPVKQEKTEAQKKKCRGALGLMSQNAVKESRAQLRPFYLTSRLYIVRQNMPFPLKRPYPTLPPVPSTVQTTKEDTPIRKMNEASSAMNTKFKGFPVPDPQKKKSNNNDSIESKLIDVEKEIDEDNRKKNVNAAFKSTNVQALLQVRRQSLDSKKNQVVQKQKVIVMKRISSSSKTAQNSSLLKFPSITYSHIEKSENPLSNSLVTQEVPQVPVEPIDTNKQSSLAENASKDIGNVDKIVKVLDNPSVIAPMETEAVINISNESVEIDKIDDSIGTVAANAEVSSL